MSMKKEAPMNWGMTFQDTGSVMGGGMVSSNNVMDSMSEDSYKWNMMHMESVMENKEKFVEGVGENMMMENMMNLEMLLNGVTVMLLSSMFLLMNMLMTMKEKSYENKMDKNQQLVESGDLKNKEGMDGVMSMVMKMMMMTLTSALMSMSLLYEWPEYFMNMGGDGNNNGEMSDMSKMEDSSEESKGEMKMSTEETKGEESTTTEKMTEMEELLGLMMMLMLSLSMFNGYVLYWQMMSMMMSKEDKMMKMMEGLPMKNKEKMKGWVLKMLKYGKGLNSWYMMFSLVMMMMSTNVLFLGMSEMLMNMDFYMEDHLKKSGK